MGRSRDIADMLSKTELVNTGNEALITTFDAVDSAYVSSNVTPALVFYSTLDSLPVSGLSVGQQAYVNANNRLYISDGSGWYNKALITLSPTMTLSPSGTITLATDGVTTSTVTIVANDSDTPGSGLTYSVESDGNMLGRAVISQDSSVFTIRPLSSDSGATTGTFTLTFKTSDGVNLATDSADFSLTFVTAVDSSAETVLLMKAAGNSATNAAITYQNSSDVSTGFTEAGNPQASTLSPYRSGGYSAHFDGTGDYLSTSDASNAIGSGDFTVEAWVYVTSLSSDCMIASSRVASSSSTLYWSIYAHSDGRALFITRNSSGTEYVAQTTTGTIEINKWYHVAGVRESGVNKVYVNGTVGGTTADDGGLNVTEATIGVGFFNYPGYVAYMFGYIRDFRLVKGTAVYTSNFTPPTEALTAVSGTELLTCHLPYFADGSTNGHSITVNGNAHTVPFGPHDYEPWTADDVGGSVYFDGNGDYVDATIGTAPGTGDFTYEGWFRADDAATGTSQYIFDTSNDGFGTGGLSLYVGTGGEFGAWAENGGVAISYLGVGRIYWDKTWHHFAWVRSGSTMNFYIDGKLLSGPHTYTRSLYSTDFRLGYNGRTTPTLPFTGSIADFRYTRSAVYTTEFTPPTAPLGHITNTELLMNNKSDANIYDAAAAYGLSLYNGTVSSTTQRKFTTSSAVYFDGTNDYIRNDDVLSTFGSTASPFTIEGWVYWHSTPSGFTTIVGINNKSAGSNELLIGQNANAWKLYVNATEQTPTGTITDNTWYHFAFTYDASNVKFYVDGTQTYSAAETSLGPLGNCVFLLGTEADAANGGSLGNYGGIYLQDLRISHGVRYTANFTPPTAEFEL